MSNETLKSLPPEVINSMNMIYVMAAKTTTTVLTNTDPEVDEAMREPMTLGDKAKYDLGFFLAFLGQRLGVTQEEFESFIAERNAQRTEH
jgi:hypothetical protein